MEAPELDAVMADMRALEPGARHRVTTAPAEMVAQAKDETMHDKAMRNRDHMDFRDRL